MGKVHWFPFKPIVIPRTFIPEGIIIHTGCAMATVLRLAKTHSWSFFWLFGFPVSRMLCTFTNLARAPWLH